MKTNLIFTSFDSLTVRKALKLQSTLKGGIKELDVIWVMDLQRIFPSLSFENIQETGAKYLAFLVISVKNRLTIDS